MHPLAIVALGVGVVVAAAINSKSEKPLAKTVPSDDNGSANETPSEETPDEQKPTDSNSGGSDSGDSGGTGSETSLGLDS